MKHYCPNNIEHTEFVVSVWVKEEQVVDADGNFVKTLCCTDVGAVPETGWVCKACGAGAKISS